MSHQQPDEDASPDELPPALFRYVFPTTSLVALAVVGFLLFDRPVVGVVSGAMIAVGEFFTLGHVFEQADDVADEDADEAFATGADEESRFVHPIAIGFGASSAGIVVFALYMALESLPEALGGGIAVGLAVYLLLSILVSR